MVAIMAPQQLHSNISKTSGAPDDLFVTVSNSTVPREMGTRDEKKTMTDASPQKTCGFSSRWTRTMECIKAPLLRLLLKISHQAAQHPKTCVFLIIVLSIALFCIGITTNFTTESSETVWTPQNSLPVQHGEWLEESSGYPDYPRHVLLVIHRNGNNVLGDKNGELAQEGVDMTFVAVNIVRTTKGYKELCAKNDIVDSITNETTCDIVGVTGFWNDNTTAFYSQAMTDKDTIVALSAKTFPDGTPVDRKQIMGYAEFDSDGLLMSALSYVVVIGLTPLEDEAKPVEEKIVDRILQLSDALQQNSTFRVDITSARSFEDEFGRAVMSDVPLVPVVFLIMSVLCVLIFWKPNRVQSQSLLGFGAVCTVLLAILTSFGLLFTCGVPFTNLTQILPFILFGVGLDDAFLIFGSYSRTSSTEDAVERIDETIADVGGTILLTTLTSASAFALGMISSITAVRWLVIYAFPTILIDFIYQITFFVSLIVLDERRIQANRCDCLVCCKGPDAPEESDTNGEPKNESEHVADKVMRTYCDFLLRRPVKWTVLIVFPVLLGLCAWSTSQLEQAFEFTEVLPDDSYIQSWWISFNNYYERTGIRPGVYFRNVDFSNDTIQDQMEAYVNDLATLDKYFAGQPFNFWLRDFRTFVNTTNGMPYLSFEQQLDWFLHDPVFAQIYKYDIVRDAYGIMTTSRTTMNMDNLDYEIVTEQVNALEAQREITSRQPINQGQASEWPFFTFDENYYIMEFYRVAPEELILSTILGTVTVSVLAVIFIPHWSAVFFVGPMVAILYIDLLGVVQWAGLAVNPVTYIAMVMSIGLMVDYVMHVTLRFVEIPGSDRIAKTKETLTTIGASVMLGGVSTMLGVLPLAFSTSEIFFTVFIIFFSLVVLGLLSGLVWLPVILSYVGPIDRTDDKTDTISDTEDEGDPEEPPFMPHTYCALCQGLQSPES